MNETTRRARAREWLRPTNPIPDLWRLRGMAVLFAIGSLLFIGGAVMSGLTTDAVTTNWTYVLGAACFTLAALIQWRTAVAHFPNVKSLRLRAETAIRNADWLSAVVQLLGTIAFNVMTIRALSISLGYASTTAQQVWRPDVVGSALFLVSSAIAFQPVARARRHRLLPRRRSGWICALNLLGSVFFAVSAIAAQTTPEGVARSAFWSNFGTILGGLGFLAAAVLLLPAWTGWDQPMPPATAKAQR